MTDSSKRARKVRPGTPVRGSTTGRPVMVLLDLLGRRQALRLLWELRDGALTFRQLQERCDGASPSVINTRIGELREVGIVVHEPGAGYTLTALGRSLLEALAPLNDWAQHWSVRLDG